MYVKSVHHSISNRHFYIIKISNISYLNWYLKYSTIIFIFSSKFVSNKGGTFLVKATKYEDVKKFTLDLLTLT